MDDGQNVTAKVQSRAYQLEMFQLAMQQNIIVAVSVVVFSNVHVDRYCRWIQDRAKHRCTDSREEAYQLTDLMLRAILRMEAELLRTPHKVRHEQVNVR